MLRLQKVTNGSFEEELALINADTNEVITKGDYYHDKIDEYIDGVLYGLSYVNVDYEELEARTVTPDMDLFKICDFYNEDYEEDESEEDEENDDQSDEETNEIKQKTEEKIILLPHQVMHNFKIYGDGTRSLYCDIIKALEKTRDCEADLFCTDNSDERIIYSCLGLENEDNNDLLKEFGVFYNKENRLEIIK